MRVPDTHSSHTWPATPAAIGFARAAGLPYREGLVKNRYIGRTFIQPDNRLRQRVRTRLFSILRYLIPSLS